MGEVYRAYDERLQREVAIKVLSASEPGDDAAGARLLREARAAAALNHPNICTIHEVGEEDGRAFIAMELVEGQTLHEIVPPGTGLPLDRVFSYGLQIADALAHAHDRGVLHRDFKSQNIVITAAGRAKVLDFGLAKRVLADADATTGIVSLLTAPGTLIGTPAYMAPEQLRGVVADARSDVWAFGVVLHEMVAGERPFAGATLYEVSSAILNTPPRALPEHAPRELQAVVRRCLEKEPADRFQRAGDVLTALDAVRAGTAPEPAWRLPRTGRSLAGAATAAALVAVIAGPALNVGGIRDRLWNPEPTFDSIAVMPLEDAGGTGDEGYLAAGIQQGLITELAQLPGLTKVVAAASTRRFTDSTQGPAQIAKALDVRALVTGSVVRTAGGVTIAAQLVDGTTERQVWGQTYEREQGDVRTLHNDVAAAIAEAIELRLRPSDRQRLTARARISPETYELYLRGMGGLDEGRDGTPDGGLH